MKEKTETIPEVIPEITEDSEEDSRDDDPPADVDNDEESDPPADVDHEELSVIVEEAEESDPPAVADHEEPDASVGPNTSSVVEVGSSSVVEVASSSVVEIVRPGWSEPSNNIIDVTGGKFLTGVEETIKPLSGVEETDSDDSDSDETVVEFDTSVETIIDEIIDDIGRRSSSSDAQISGNTEICLDSTDLELEERNNSLLSTKSVLSRSKSYEELTDFWSQQDIDDLSAQTPAPMSRTKRKASPGLSPEEVRSRRLPMKRRKSYNDKNLNQAKKNYFTALSNIMSVGSIDLMVPAPKEPNDDECPSSPRSELKSIMSAINRQTAEEESVSTGACDITQ